MNNMASVKTKKEISLIKKACEITDCIFSEIISLVNLNDMTEKELAKFIKSRIKYYKCKPSFRAIVAASGAASTPHHKPAQNKLKGFVVIDFGVIYKKYMSDMTRTIYVGKPSEKEKKIYNLVLKSQQKAKEAIEPIIKCRDVDAVSRKVLGKWNKYFIHGLGHGVGTRIHEMPRLNKKSRYYVKRDMVITIEPGVYVKRKFGIRIEDTCIVQKSGCINLTKSTKKLLTF